MARARSGTETVFTIVCRRVKGEAPGYNGGKHGKMETAMFDFEALKGRIRRCHGQKGH